MSQVDRLSLAEPSAVKFGGTRELLAVALPMFISQACETAMIFTDRVFLAKVASADMNAAMAGGLACFAMTTFLIGLTGYTTALVAQYLGAGRKDRCAVALFQAILVCGLGYPVLLALRPLVAYAFRHIGLPEDQLAPQITYFNILVFASVLFLLRGCLAAFFSGIGRTRVVMAAAVAAMLTNIPANYVLIYGKLGLPAMGIRGAAYGTVLGSAVGACVLLAAYLRRSNRREFGLAHSFRFDREAMGKLLRFGYPAGVEFFLNMLAFNTIILTFHSDGPVTAVAVTILFSYDLIAFVPIIGLQIAVMSLVGRYMGARSPDCAHKATIAGLRVAWVYATIMLVTFVSFPEQLVNVFRPSAPSETFDQAFEMSVFMVRLVSVYVMIDAMGVIFSGALRGAGDTFWTMCISVGVHWTLVPLVFVLLHVFHVPARWTWVTMVAVFACFCTVLYLRYRAGKWRTIRVVQTEAELLAAAQTTSEVAEPLEL